MGYTRKTPGKRRRHSDSSYDDLSNILIKKKSEKSVQRNTAAKKKKRRPKEHENETENENGYEQLTPKLVLFYAFEKLVEDLKRAHERGEPDGYEYFDQCQRYLVQQLSLLGTAGKDATLLGHDFNEFFYGYINTLNTCGRMKKLLDDNGIEFDITGEF